MPEFGRGSLLLLGALLTGQSLGILGTVDVSKSGCLGSSVELFQNVRLDGDNNACSLYIHRSKESLIVMWSMQNSVVNETFLNGYSEKFFLDKFGIIWIRDLHDTDEASYVIKCTKGNPPRNDRVKLDVLVAPDTGCKPKIVHGLDSLTSYLDSDGCGDPRVNVYWLDQSGISVQRNELKLSQGQELGTVFACLYGPALKCATTAKLSDYCTFFKHESMIDSKLSALSKQISDSATMTVATFIFVVFGVLGIIAFLIVIPYIWKKNAGWMFSVKGSFLKGGVTDGNNPYKEVTTEETNPFTDMGIDETNPFRGMGREKTNPFNGTSVFTDPGLFLDNFRPNMTTTV